MKNNIIELDIRIDERGSLSVIEGGITIPFEMKRVFYIYGMNMFMSRGAHAHYKTKQLLTAVSGSCKVTLDNGKQKTTYDLDKPNICLLQNEYVWITMHDFSNDCVIMVIASEHYDPSDYITDYNEFCKMVNL